MDLRRFPTASRPHPRTQAELAAATNTITLAKAQVESAATKAATTPAASVAESPAAADPAKDKNPFGKLSKAMEKMMTSEAGKEAMKQGSKGMVEAISKELLELMDLDPEAKKAFLSALTDAQMEQQALGMKMLSAGKMTKEEREALSKDLKDKHEAHEAKIKEILGNDEKFSQYKQYQDSMPERQQLGGMKDRFSAANAPMSEEQEQQIMDVMYSERKNMKWDHDYADQQDINPEKFTDASIARYEAQSKEYDQRMEARLQGTFSEPQMEAFREQRNMQHTMESMGLNFAKAMFGEEK